jgi:hypothetical protein
MARGNTRPVCFAGAKQTDLPHKGEVSLPCSLSRCAIRQSPLSTYHRPMKFVCDAPERKTWFRIETEGEAITESEIMKHAVEKYFRREHEKAVGSYRPASAAFIERDIGLGAHVQATMPWFLTLRDAEGSALATAMLPPGGKDDSGFRIIIVGPSNSDPYPAHGPAIAALAAHVGFALAHDRCFPYARGV